jgi:hypothetical protein
VGTRRSAIALVREGHWLRTTEERRVTDDDGALSDQRPRRFLLQTRTLRYPAINQNSSLCVLLISRVESVVADLVCHWQRVQLA